MEALVGFVFEEEGVERAEVFGCGAGVQVEDGGEREAEVEVVRCALGELARGEGGEGGEGGVREEEGVEVVGVAFVSGEGDDV